MDAPETREILIDITEIMRSVLVYLHDLHKSGCALLAALEEREGKIGQDYKRVLATYGDAPSIVALLQHIDALLERVKKD